jgi:ATP-binding cassette subfamily A (ABC1) protein 3
LYSNLSRRDKLGFSLLSNSAMSLGLQVMFTAELAGPGVQWDTISTLPSTDENLHLGHVCIMLAIDILLYMIIAWYIDGIKPGKYGIAKPLYFPFLPSYWLGRPRNVAKNKVRISPMMRWR